MMPRWFGFAAGALFMLAVAVLVAVGSSLVAVGTVVVLIGALIVTTLGAFVALLLRQFEAAFLLATAFAGILTVSLLLAALRWLAGGG